MKLVLFDVDGTLLTASGAGRRALTRALTDVFGTTGPIERYDFRGATDTQIIRDLMGAAGVLPAEIDAGQAGLFARYVECLEAEIGDGREVTVYPGIRALVQTLAAAERCVLGLLTGNVEGGARVKLQATGLWPHFRLGAYGSDHADRRALPAVAARRAEALVGRAFEGVDTVVIGDTPRDIDCARAFGATVVAVATGWHTLESLAEHRPDHLFADFRDTSQALRAILG